MATRLTEYQRKCPANIKALIDTARTTQMYVLQEMGPMAFMVADEANSKKFKVSLGQIHTCSCKSKCCLHMMWLLLKLFHVDPKSDMLYQTSLVDREINEILNGRHRIQRVVLEKQETAPEDSGVKQRPIEDELCRNSFGSMSEVEKQISELLTVKEPDTRKLDFSHFGYTCKSCSNGPIKGRLHKCQICLDLFLCDHCFKEGSHPEHAFEYRNRSTSKWKKSTRSLQPALPTALIEDIQNRELTGEDYQTLLTLDAGMQIQGNIPLHVVNSFPVTKMRNSNDKTRLRLDQSGNCNVCASKIGYGDLVRQIPCGHGFHQSCIDRWLLHSRANCPTCGSAAYFSAGEEIGLAPNLDNSTYHAAQTISNATARKKRREKKENRVTKTSLSDPGSWNLQVVGSNSILEQLGGSQPAIIPAAAESASIKREKASPYTLGRKYRSESKKQSSLKGKKTLGLPPIPAARKVEKEEINLLVDSTKLLLI
ncbi:E3 ubiquitin-protein ligase Zswim2 [Terramyces sp. JEL0728]|nr:E3 ubiquitin-protein ligase Zswim2 [Terramyces sp. JEL0728]